MNVLMQLLESQGASSSPRFSSLGKSATGGGPFAELLAALQQLHDGEASLDSALADQLAALESQPTLFAALIAQPIPFDEVAGEGRPPEGTIEEALSALPDSFDEEALLEELPDTTDSKQATTAVPDADEAPPPLLPAARPERSPTQPVEAIAPNRVQTAQRNAEDIVEVAPPPPLRPQQSSARFAQVENRARAAEEALAAFKASVENTMPATSESLEGGELERLTLRMGHASERALAGGLQAMARLNPELSDRSGLQFGQQINTTTGSQAPATTATPPSLGAGETPTTPAPPQQVRVEHLGPDLVRTVRFLANSEQSTITVKLIPAHLGELQVEVLHRGEEVSVRLLSGQSSVRETLESQVHLLREQLTRDGTVIHRIEVAPQLSQDSQQGQSGSRETQQQQQQSGAWQGQRRQQGRGEPRPSDQTPDRERHVPNAQSALNIMI